MSKKISELPNAGALTGGDELIPIVQDGDTVKTTVQDIADYAGSGATWGSITGTLSAQTDLDTALSGKVPTARTINGYDLSINRTLTATDVDALKRDGSNANSDVDLGTYALNAKAIKVNGTGGSGHVSMKHQSSGATATASESVIYADSFGNPRWKNDGNAVQSVLLSGTTTSDISDSTNKRYQTDNQQLFNDATSSIQTQLDGKQSKLLVKKIGASGTITTTTESIIGNIEILGGTLASTDYLNIKSRVRKTGSNGTYLLRYYLNTSSNTLTGATQIAISATQTTSSIISANFERDFIIDGGNLYGYPFATANNDGIVSATAVGSVAYTVATTYYIITTITLASALDTGALIGQKITNF